MSIPRLPVWLQIPVLGALCVVVYFATAIGGFLRELPISQVEYLLRLMRERATFEDRVRYRIGPDYRFIDFVRDQTPGDAVILMTDQFAPSSLDPLKGKHQGWLAYFLYPRKFLYLHQEESPWYEEATWLIVDDPIAVSWIAPSHELPFLPGQLGCVPFDMGAYMDEIRSGRISEVYLPPHRPFRAPKQAWPEAGQ